MASKVNKNYDPPRYRATTAYAGKENHYRGIVVGLGVRGSPRRYGDERGIEWVIIMRSCGMWRRARVWLEKEAGDASEVNECVEWKGVRERDEETRRQRQRGRERISSEGRHLQHCQRWAFVCVRVCTRVSARFVTQCNAVESLSTAALPAFVFANTVSDINIGREDTSVSFSPCFLAFLHFRETENWKDRRTGSQPTRLTKPSQRSLTM